MCEGLQCFEEAATKKEGLDCGYEEAATKKEGLDCGYEEAAFEEGLGRALCLL